MEKRKFTMPVTFDAPKLGIEGVKEIVILDESKFRWPDELSARWYNLLSEILAHCDVTVTCKAFKKVFKLTLCNKETGTKKGFEQVPLMSDDFESISETVADCVANCASDMMEDDGYMSVRPNFGDDTTEEDLELFAEVLVPEKFDVLKEVSVEEKKDNDWTVTFKLDTNGMEIGDVVTAIRTVIDGLKDIDKQLL